MLAFQALKRHEVIGIAKDHFSSRANDKEDFGRAAALQYEVQGCELNTICVRLKAMVAQYSLVFLGSCCTSAIV